MIRACAALLLCAALSACNGAFYLPDRYLYARPDQIGVPYEETVIDDGRGPKLYTWLLSAEQPKGLIVHLHGNAENMSSHLASVYWLPARGYDVLLADYRGYGGSAGEPSMAGVNDDVARVFRYAELIAKRRNERMILFGQSLGGAMGLYAAALPEFSGRFDRVVIESAFSEYRGIAREKISDNILTSLLSPLLYTISSQFDPIANIAAVRTGGLLFVHSEEDPVVAISHSERLFDAAPEPKQLWRVPGAAHGSAFRDSQLREKLLEFLDSRP